MKCSHGVQFEVKCRQCFDDAMKRVSASQPKMVYESRGKPEPEKVFYLGDIRYGVDKDPRPL